MHKNRYNSGYDCVHVLLISVILKHVKALTLYYEQNVLVWAGKSIFFVLFPLI